MDQALSNDGLTTEQNRRILEVVAKEQARLRNFIRRRVRDVGDAEDILQEVFSELVDAYRLLQPVELAGAWLFRVARNRIVDLFRKPSPVFPGDQWEDLLPSNDAGPEAAYARRVLLEEMEAALEDLSHEQREVFLAHEVEGLSFKEISAASGVGVNTLLARKRQAVLKLRRRLQAVHQEFKS